jgi:hypothetical protein
MCHFKGKRTYPSNLPPAHLLPRISNPISSDQCDKTIKQYVALWSWLCLTSSHLQRESYPVGRFDMWVVTIWLDNSRICRESCQFKLWQLNSEGLKRGGRGRQLFKTNYFWDDIDRKRSRLRRAMSTESSLEWIPVPWCNVRELKLKPHLIWEAGFSDKDLRVGLSSAVLLQSHAVTW